LQSSIYMEQNKGKLSLFSNKIKGIDILNHIQNAKNNNKKTLQNPLPK
jgi:hypothetical protein